ncbi:MAG: nucleoside hydrolase [Pseudomonadota bacterium]
MATPVIIDTDPGIDDAVAIFCALGAPGLDVLGLTTVAGNISLARTTRNAGGILAFADVDRPVFSGADRPLKRAPFAALDVHGEDGLGGIAVPEPREPALTGAVDWIANTLRQYAPGTVDLLVLGPMTNVAQLIEQDADAARRLRRVIAMGGAIDEPGNVGPKAEFNMAADPEAAEVVFAAGLPLTLIPLDVTRRVRAAPGDVARLAASGRPEAQASAALIDAYFKSTDGGDVAESRPLHDPCVVLFAEAPELFTCETMHLSVDLSAPRDGGALLSGRHPVQVARKVDGAAALAHILTRLTAP